ncbi:MAG TPA: response regulator, partial [Pseudorhodoferax sp.]|nr:response regulator [Pseudorhodoferax sp.]
QRRRGTAAQGPAPAMPGSTRPLAGLTLLVVDDSEINREVAQRILQHQGATVVQASDGGQALALLAGDAGSRVDVVLMDVQMPVMDGIEATRRIRAQPQLARLPVIALTAGAFKSQQDAAWAAGMNGFIGKPFDVAQAVALILRLAGRTVLDNGAAPADAPAPATQTPPPDLPGIDLAQAMQIWPDTQAYRRFLQRFVQQHGDNGQQVAELLAAGERERAAGVVHQLRGAAAHLALPETADAAAELEGLLLVGADPAAALQRLRASLERACASVERLYPASPAPASTQAVQPPDARQRTLLQSLLAALAQDNPGPAEPVLAALAPTLSPSDLQALQGLLDDYDFRGAEEQVRRLLDAH